jgi:hypothetical protein
VRSRTRVKSISESRFGGKRAARSSPPASFGAFAGADHSANDLGEGSDESNPNGGDCDCGGGRSTSRLRLPILDRPLDQVSKIFTGRYANYPMGYLLGAMRVARGSGLLAAFGRRL